MHKDVFVIYGEPKYFIPFFNKKGIPTYPVFKGASFLFRVIRRIFFTLTLPKPILYAAWKYKLKDAKTVIFFSTEYIGALRYIKSINPKIRIVFWYWNPVFRSIKPDNVPDNLGEKWSFDRNDSKNFNMKFNTTFYFDNIKLPQNNIIYDVVFVGLDKGRRSFINNIKDEMVRNDVNPYFYIVDDDANKRSYKGSFPTVSYDKYLSIISKSTAILDFVQDGQDGLTLRPMEALFFRKKLITNDASIKTYNFYRQSNIFIIGVDDIKHLKHFLNVPYEPVSDEILMHYDVSNWIKRFIE